MSVEVVRGDGVDLSVGRLGAGPPVLLLHGFLASRWSWRHLAPVADVAELLTIDHRGHGDSGRAPTPAGYSFDALVADALAVLDHLDVGPVHVVGHSMGGVVALRLAIDHPDRVASLVCWDTAAEPSGPRLHALAAVGRLPAPLLRGLLRGLAGAAALVGGRTGPPAGAIDPAERQAAFRHDLDRFDPAALEPLWRELGDHPSLVPDLGRIAVPTTVVVGERDPLRPAADVLAAGIPSTELVVIAGAGHDPQSDDPAACEAALRAHLARATA